MRVGEGGEDDLFIERERDHVTHMVIYLLLYVHVERYCLSPGLRNTLRGVRSS